MTMEVLSYLCWTFAGVREGLYELYVCRSWRTGTEV